MVKILTSGRDVLILSILIYCMYTVYSSKSSLRIFLMFKAIVVLLHMYDYIIFPVQYLLIQFFCMPRCYFQNLPSSYNAKCSVYTNFANVSLSWLCENAQPAHIFGVVNILLTMYSHFSLPTTAYFSDYVVTCYKG